MKKKPVAKDGAPEYIQNQGGLTVTIPCPRIWPAIVFVMFSVLVWAWIEMMFLSGIYGIIKKSTTGVEADWSGVPMMLLVLALWTLGGVFTIRRLLMMLMGKEIIRITDKEFSIIHKIGKWGKPRKFKINKITNLRINEDFIEPRKGDEKRENERTPAKALVFKYEQSPVRFAAGVTVNEAKAVLDRIKNHPSMSEANFEDEEKEE